jgi:uncharacterized damage-inducible protein DinB
LVSRRQWFDRQFESGIPVEAYPDIIERLRGTPARVEERVRRLDSAVLTNRVADTWSIQENVGHLVVVESLWDGRIDELAAGAEHLRPADLTNRRTEDSRFNGLDLAEILAEFRAARRNIVAKLEGLTPAQLATRAIHPRLQQPMSAVDLAFFAAEHDDHHLARITEILRLPSH